MSDENGLSEAQAAYGIKLFLGNNNDPETVTFTEIAEITDLGDFASQWDTYEATNKQSQRLRQYKSSLRTIQDMDVEMNYYGDTTQDSRTGLGYLHSLGDAGVRLYKLVIPIEGGNEDWTQSMWVKKWAVGGKLTDGTLCKATFTTIGVPALQGP